jgi:hypothetical protein
MMCQPYPSSGQSAGPGRPAVPAPVRTAVKLMYAGAAVSTVPLIIAAATPIAGDISAYHLTVLGHHLTAAQISQWRPLIIAVVTVAGLIVPAVWLWMARANSQGRNWARTVSTVLFALATLHLAGNHGAPQVILAVLAWLVGLAAVLLLWCPASSAFFNQGLSPGRAVS